MENIAILKEEIITDKKENITDRKNLYPVLPPFFSNNLQQLFCLNELIQTSKKCEIAYLDTSIKNVYSRIINFPFIKLYFISKKEYNLSKDIYYFKYGKDYYITEIYSPKICCYYYFFEYILTEWFKYYKEFFTRKDSSKTLPDFDIIYNFLETKKLTHLLFLFQKQYKHINSSQKISIIQLLVSVLCVYYNVKNVRELIIEFEPGRFLTISNINYIYDKINIFDPFIEYILKQNFINFQYHQISIEKEQFINDIIYSNKV